MRFPVFWLIKIMPIHEIDIQLFEKIDMDCLASGSHAMSKGTLMHSNKIWFCKAASNALRARYEVLAQEFYRLIISGQPETRIAKQLQNNEYFILSEEVSGIQQLPLNKQARFTNGVYTGLGEILIVSIFLHEIDLNLGNVVINSNNKVIKIDGDWSMASLVRPDLLDNKPAQITPRLLESLPYLPPSDYVAHNWLDICSGGNVVEKSAIFHDDLLIAPHYIAEINQAILGILLLPRHFIQQFINMYMLEDTGSLLDIVLMRQAELKESAMQTASFIAYITSPEARTTARHQFDHMKQFSANDLYPIIHPTDHGMLQQSFDALRSELMPNDHGSPNTVTVIDVLDGAIDPPTLQTPTYTTNKNRFFSSSAFPGTSALRLNRTYPDLSAL